MKKTCFLTSTGLCLVLALAGITLARQTALEYPYYLLDVYNPDEDCWYGMDIEGRWPLPVVPEQLLVGRPPSGLSGVTIPTDHWVELKFRGRLIDGPGDDIFLIELDAVDEQALVFITDGSGREYLLGYALVPDIGSYEQTEIGFDIAGASFPFVPSAIRILGLDLRGGSPGFDLANVRARINADCGYTACNPSPADGAKNVSLDTVLKWSPGRSAEKHIVYFGTTLADVDESAIPVSSPPLDAGSFTPSALELGKTYYWRLDEVNDTDDNSPWTGNIWKFSTVDYLVVDNFESYDRFTIYDTWTQIDQAYIYLSKNPEPVYRCRQSMAFRYYYDPGFSSEAARTFSSAQDWASAGVKSLELFFYGKADNDTDAQMYFALGDGDVNAAVPYNGDAKNLGSETWQPWRIDLQNLGVNLSNIEHISIGFRNRTSESSGLGIGTVFFDDIRLYPSRCLQERRPDADFDGDCAVDFQDIQDLAYNWLDKGYNIFPAAAPKAPVAWYKFDGSADDSAGSAHGQPRGSPAYVEGVFGRAISFDGYKDSVEITDAPFLFSRIKTAITIAFWQYGTDSIHHTDTLCCSDYAYNVYDPTIAINLGCWYNPRRLASQGRGSGGGKYNWDCGSPWSFDSRLSGSHKYKTEWSGRWNHWAFTKDVESGKMQIFLNGLLYDSRTGANSPISGITSFEIGSGWYGGYDGLIDDFQIYDYALSQAEIVYAATNGTGIFDLPLLLPADLNSDNRIDFKDFAILADSWLSDQLWP